MNDICVKKSKSAETSYEKKATFKKEKFKFVSLYCLQN